MHLLSILCISLTAVSSTLGNKSQDGVQANGDTSYEFGYDIHNPLSNDIKSHHEIRDGKNVLGFYTFKEADGTIRIVKYKVGPETGFEAVVEKLNPNQLAGNSIDGQEASPSTHGAPQIINEPNAGHNSQFVSGSVHRLHDINSNQNQPESVPPQRVPARTYATKEPEHQYPDIYRNPFVIRNNVRSRNYQKSTAYGTNQAHNENGKDIQEAGYVEVPRGRQRNPHVYRPLPNHRHLHEQQTIRLPPYDGNHASRIAIRAQIHAEPYVNNVVAQPNQYPTGPIVYIDGVPYIDDIGAFPHLHNQVVDSAQVSTPNQEPPQYEVVENPEKVEENEADRKDEGIEQTDDEDEKEDYEEGDEDDGIAEYEDSENEDEDTDASDFYEQNEQIINEQKEQYDKLKKAYEDDGEDLKKEEVKGAEEEAERKTEPSQDQ